ncbi:hypothetical protein HNR23_001589 [Nocardiopsis mwathae]|uniref:Lipoprotein n=1 Tax=Nocardiopsis mwathae TaxID=1472723 RepID=A0A7X0D5X0_9ACTN|nr:hypothetical protein [Nocardiopsis mwathae]MBB6171529.1 hypothetical protein [Nocardiopsis mwathae]
MGRRSTSTAAIALAAALLLPGCASELVEFKRVTGELSAALMRKEAQDHFARKGHPIQGRLECEPNIGKPADLVVECIGVTHADGEARFVGSIDRDRLAHQEPGDASLPGEYLGTVDGEEVFRMNCFSCRPQAPSA